MKHLINIPVSLMLSLLLSSFWSWGQAKTDSLRLPYAEFVEQRVIQKADWWFELHRVRLSPDVVCMLDFFYKSKKDNYCKFRIEDAHQLFHASVGYYTYWYHHIVFIAKNIPRRWIKVYPPSYEKVFYEGDFAPAEPLPALNMPDKLQPSPNCDRTSNSIEGPLGLPMLEFP